MGKKKKNTKSSGGEGIAIVAVNKKARRDYEIVDTLEAGVMLQGSEVKSVRSGSINLKESYVRLQRGEVFLVGCHISPYSHAPVDAHEPTRDRKLLLHDYEIKRMIGQIEQKGLTIVPLRVYFKKGRCKIEIAVGRGKKFYDKRQDVKQKEADREMERALKHR